MVTPANIFRGLTQGDLKGHPISQFLLKPIPTLSTRFPQKARVGFPDYDYMTSPDEWSLDQAGLPPFRDEVMDPYLRIYVMAAIWRNGCITITFTRAPECDVDHYGFRAGIGLQQQHLSTQPIQPVQELQNRGRNGLPSDSFKSQGLLGVACQEALRAAWYQKWRVHRTSVPSYRRASALHAYGRSALPLHPD
jgi:hypothetical protein